MDTPDSDVQSHVPFPEAFRYWLRLGFINFGGPAGQIAIMHDDLVDRRAWIGNNRFLHALNYCMLLPGPEAQQLAIYIGWLLNGTWGGIVAGVLFVLPAFFLIMLLSWTYAVHGDVAWVAAIFYGLRSAVVAIVLLALIRIGSKALKDGALIAIATASFVAIFLVKIPFPLIIVGAALLGVVDRRRAVPNGHLTDEDAVVDRSERARGKVSTGPARSLRVLLTCLAVWWLPLFAVIAWRGTDDTLSKEALFFSQTAMVTFGGAYAVLAYIDQVAVGTFGWLEPGQMVTGLGLAESTPGPLIMVTQFVGFLGAFRFPGGLDPVVAGVLGATVTVWATFAPCFLWIFLGAPYIERLRGNVRLQAALSAVTAAVVGVIANLATTFALAVLFDEVRTGRGLGMTIPVPSPGSLDVFAAALAVVSFFALWRLRLNVLWVVGGCALAGLAYRILV